MQLAPHDPVLDGAQFRRVVLALVAGLGLHHVLEDLAEAAGNRAQFRLSQGLRYGDLRQSFGDLLARPVHVGGVVEHDGDEREPEAAEAALLDDAGHVARGLLDGEGDQALDVAGAQRGAHGDHLHLVVGDVGHGVDRQLGDVVGAKADEAEDQKPDDELLLDGECDDAVQHGYDPLRLRTPLAAWSGPRFDRNRKML